MKKTVVITIVTAFVFMLVPNCAFALTNTTFADTNAILLEDGYYYETVIEDECSDLQSVAYDITGRSTGATITKTKSKTTYLKNSSGEVMWYVKVTGTFTYGNGTSICTKSVCTAESKNKTWKVTNRSSSKAGNKASATAKGTHYLNGFPAESITKTVTLKCSPTGVFS